MDEIIDDVKRIMLLPSKCARMSLLDPAGTNSKKKFWETKVRSIAMRVSRCSLDVTMHAISEAPRTPLSPQLLAVSLPLCAFVV